MATTKKTTADQRVDVFEDFRKKALTLQERKDSKVFVTDEPFELGEKYGITPPIVVHKPKFSDRIRWEAALNSGNPITVMQVLFGEEYPRVLRVLDAVGDDAELIAVGFVMAVLEHFYGVGFEAALTGGFTKPAGS